MLRVVHSNRSSALAEALVDSVGPLPDPFVPLRVVVAGRLMERWLMRQLAERHGIAAGIRWQSFESMLVSAYAGDELGRTHRLTAIDRASLPLALASVLATFSGAGMRGARGRDPTSSSTPSSMRDPLLDPVLGPVRAYLASDDPLDVARRVQLAERLADLYWSYGLSRPQWLLAWARRDVVAEHRGDPAAGWQAEVWARLIEHVAATDPQDRKSRYERREPPGRRWAIPPLLPALRRELALPSPTVGRLAVVGFPYLTRAYLDALTDLGATSEITLYLVNPCQELWEDVGPGQLANEPAPLVLWGRPIRDTVSALIERTSGNFEDRFVDPVAASDPSAAPITSAASAAPVSALAHLLGDVMRRTSREVSDLGRAVPAVRAGVTVLDCPSIRRELEVIGSEVLRLLAADSTLSAHHIAILVAGRDADSYLEQAAAALQAVGPVPCHLIDAPLAESGRIVDGLGALLELPHSKMTRRDLLRVMTHPAVIGRYPHADAEQWVRWTERLGVAHGADASAHRHTYLEEHRELFHWDQGIRRLAMGAFMVGERAERGPATIGDRVLVPEELRADDHASAATFALLARSLISDATWMRDAVRPLAVWAEVLTTLVDAYLEPIDDSALHELDRTRRILAQLADHDLDGRLVDFREVKEIVTRRLAGLTTDRGEPLAAGVMVAPLSSFRPIPFRHVFVAGLGDGEFPAAEGRHPLDLRQQVRFGDVSPRERDRHSFFDAVLAASEGLWLSYVGLHPKSGDRTGPSSVIVELADAIAPYLGAAAGAEALAALTVVHPLHRFDRRYDPRSDARSGTRSDARSASRSDEAAVGPGPGAGEGGALGGAGLTLSAAAGTVRELWAREVREALVGHLRARNTAIPDEDRLLQLLAATARSALSELAEEIGVVAVAPPAPAAASAPSASSPGRPATARASTPAAAGSASALVSAAGSASASASPAASGTGSAGAASASGPSPRATIAARTLGLSTLRDFLEYPVQAWAHAVLGLDELPDEILLEKSDEPFAVGAAERAVLLREVMAAHLRDPSIPLSDLYEAQVSSRRMRSKFPVGVFGRAVAHGDLQVLEVWRRALGPLAVTGPEAVVRHGFGRSFAPHTQLHDAIELSLELRGEVHNVRLIGQTEMIVGRHGSVIFKTGKMSEREHLRGAFDNVVLAAAELSTDGHAHLVIDGDGDCKRVTHAPWTREDARAYLTTLATDLFGQPHGYVLTLTQLRDALRGRAVRGSRTTGSRRDDARSLGFGPINRSDGLAEPPSVEVLARRRLLPLVIRMDGDHPFEVGK